MDLTSKIVAIIREKKRPRVFSLTLDGRKIWIKQSAPGDKNLWHRLLFILARITGNPYLTPTVVSNPEASLSHEATKLAELRAAGVKVPEVLLQHRDFLVLSDCGIPVNALLRAKEKRVDLETKILIVRQISFSLANLHNSGLYHSRPALKDLTYMDNRVYFVDFEENLDGILSTDQAIIRDAFIYIHTLFRSIGDHRLRDQALRHYIKSLDPAIWAMVRNEALKHRKAYHILKLLHPLLGKDGKALSAMLGFLFVQPTSI